MLKWIPSFARRRGKKLHPRQQHLIDTILPTLRVPLNPLVLHALFPNPTQTLRLEIGFGGGEHLAHHASLNPDMHYIGCEPYINGVAKCLVAIEDKQLSNIRIHNGDARDLITQLPDACLEHVFILFPDPWPKLRHHKRRLVQKAFLTMLAPKMQTGATLQLATDHVDYAQWMIEHCQYHPDFTWQKQSDYNTPPAQWTKTRYQCKAEEEGRSAQFFRLVKN